MKRHLKSEKGLSILEIVASLLIISIIIIAVIPLFVTSAKTVEKSGDIIDATYTAQNAMEEVRNALVNKEIGTLSLALYVKGKIPAVWGSSRLVAGATEYTKIDNGYILKLTIKEHSINSNLAKVLITASPQNKPAVIDSQMETIIQWKK